MPKLTYDKAQRRQSLLVYAFTPTHIKEVFVRMVTSYETPRIVTMRSIPIALTCRFVQLLIFLYGFVYILWYRRGYQDHDPSLISSTTLKVRGIGHFGDNDTMIFDHADYIIPTLENNAVFIMTNLIRTNQEQTFCGEDMNLTHARCTKDAECNEKSRGSKKRNGIWTERCRLPEGLCEIKGWCPVENDYIIPKPIIDTLNYTIRVQNFVQFTRFRISRRNFFDETSDPRTCLYHPVHAPICPIFRIADVLNMVETDDDERQKMLVFGAVVRIKIDWICNLDLGIEQCKPEYSFGRLDSRSRDESFSFGFNFRYASHWQMNDISHRTLTKAFGLRFIVSVSGDAGRFDFLVLTLHIGSMIGVLGLATFICDILALYFSDQSYSFREKKFQIVDLPRTSVNSTILNTR